MRNEQCSLEEFKGRVRGGEASHGDPDRWRRWQVSVGALRGYLEVNAITGMLKVEVESDRCKDDYAGEEARRKRVMEEVAKVEVEEGGSTKVLFTENGSDCLYLLTSLLGRVVVVQMASACRVEVGLKVEWGAGAGTWRYKEGEHKIAVPPGSLILANVFLNGVEATPVWHYKLLGVTHVEDRDQDGMEMQTV